MLHARAPDGGALHHCTDELRNEAARIGLARPFSQESTYALTEMTVAMQFHAPETGASDPLGLPFAAESLALQIALKGITRLHSAEGVRGPALPGRPLDVVALLEGIPWQIAQRIRGRVLQAWEADAHACPRRREARCDVTAPTSAARARAAPRVAAAGTAARKMMYFALALLFEKRSRR